MDFNSIRKNFIDFFTSSGHKYIPPAPIVNKEDPTLMFTNAGMNQFKNIFLGLSSPTYINVTNSQPCLRVSGKHNDLDDVGLDSYHHTAFEMLGNWSFGGYFKDEAIKLAWELITRVYKLDKNRIYITIFSGDKENNLPQDIESFNVWKQYIDEEKILYFDKKSNFWQMGNDGPCGPCSEIHIDIRPDDERQKIDGKTLVNQGHNQVIELWNLVFIEYNKLENGELEKLKTKHIDTGMGLERLAMVLQNKKSTYDTDIFQPIIQDICKLSNNQYGINENIDIAMRIIADHTRAVIFSIADGQLPSNDKAGYIIRKIIRRAIKYVYLDLGLKTPFIYKLVDNMAMYFKEIINTLPNQKKFITNIIKSEEELFLATLSSGLNKLINYIRTTTEKNNIIDGGTVFDLYDTYGFPYDLTNIIAKDHGLSIDKVGFEKAMAMQKNKSKAASNVTEGEWQVVNELDTVFVGYDTLSIETKISKYQISSQGGKKIYKIKLSECPFYPESGGQIGDTGMLNNSEEEISVLDTKKEHGIPVIYVNKLPNNLHIPLHANVDKDKRQKICCNHTATHLLQATLRQLLGKHIEQKGSLVNDKMLRFDFSHYDKLYKDQIANIEATINNLVRSNIAVSVYNNITVEESKKMGALALFGEKYQGRVRVVTFNKNFSSELCGGTHVNQTGELGIFKIIKEGSVSAGIRRIEAITAKEAENYINNKLDLLEDISNILSIKTNHIAAVQKILEEKKKQNTLINSYKSHYLDSIQNSLMQKAKELKNIKVIVAEVSLIELELVKELTLKIADKEKNICSIIISKNEHSTVIAAYISKELTSKFKQDANKIIQELSPDINGKGGGQNFFAIAKGTAIKDTKVILNKANKMIADEIENIILF